MRHDSTRVLAGPTAGSQQDREFANQPVSLARLGVERGHGRWV